MPHWHIVAWVARGRRQPKRVGLSVARWRDAGTRPAWCQYLRVPTRRWNCSVSRWTYPPRSPRSCPGSACSSRQRLDRRDDHSRRRVQRPHGVQAGARVGAACRADFPAVAGPHAARRRAAASSRGPRVQPASCRWRDYSRHPNSAPAGGTGRAANWTTVSQPAASGRRRGPADTRVGGVSTPRELLGGAAGCGSRAPDRARPVTLT